MVFLGFGGAPLKLLSRIPNQKYIRAFFEKSFNSVDACFIYFLLLALSPAEA